MFCWSRYYAVVAISATFSVFEYTKVYCYANQRHQQNSRSFSSFINATASLVYLLIDVSCTRYRPILCLASLINGVVDSYDSRSAHGGCYNTDLHDLPQEQSQLVGLNTS